MKRKIYFIKCFAIMQMDFEMLRVGISAKITIMNQINKILYIFSKKIKLDAIKDSLSAHTQGIVYRRG